LRNSAPKQSCRKLSIIIILLSQFNTETRRKKGFKLLFAMNVKKTSQDISATKKKKTALNFSGLDSTTNE